MTTYSQGAGANPVTQSANRPWTVEGSGSIRKVGTMQNLSNLDEDSIASVSAATRKRQSFAKDQQGYSHQQYSNPQGYSNMQTVSQHARRPSSDTIRRTSTDYRIPTNLRRNHGSASSIGCPHLRSENESVFLDKFEICEVLGEGSYGLVSKVKLRNGDAFACKAISKTDAGPKALQMLDLEIYVLKLLTHDNIVKLIEVYETPQKTRLIMEICDGGNLETLHVCDGVAAYSTKEVSVILQSLASGVAYIHDNEIVHRDLKLENVMVKTKGGFDVKICDFGLCAVKSRSELQLVCGTPIYMAPEVLCDLGKYSTLCDLWSIGVMMFRLLTVEIPFMPRNSSSSAVLEAIHNTTLEQLCARNTIFDDTHVRNCLSGLLQLEPSKRTTAKEFLNDPWISSCCGNGEPLPSSFDDTQQNVFDMMRDFSTASTKSETKSEQTKSKSKAKSKSKKETADADGQTVSPSQGGRTMFRKSNPRVLESLQGSHQTQRNSMIKALNEHKTTTPKQVLPGYMRATQSSNKSRDSLKSATGPITPELARKANVLQVRLPPLRQDAHEMFAHVGGGGMRGRSTKRHTLTCDFAPSDRQGRRNSKEPNNNTNNNNNNNNNKNIDNNNATANANAIGSSSRRDKKSNKASLEMRKNRASSMEDILSPRARNYF